MPLDRRDEVFRDARDGRGGEGARARQGGRGEGRGVHRDQVVANVSQSLVTDDDDDGFPFGGAIGSAKKTPPRTPQGSARAGLRRGTRLERLRVPCQHTVGPAATDDANGIFVPASSAMKLRGARPDVAGVVKAHLEEKMALAEEHERVWMALEKVVEGAEAARAAAARAPAGGSTPPPRDGPRKPRMARTESRGVGASRGDRLRDALRDAQALAERHAATFCAARAPRTKTTRRERRRTRRRTRNSRTATGWNRRLERCT